MENKSHAMAAGLFVMAVAAMLASLAIWLTRDDANYQSYELSTKDGVSGLQPQATVRYKGVSVGKVTRIGFDPQVNGNVLIRIAVNDHAPIGPTTFAMLGYQGVTGLAHVQLDDSEQPYPQMPPGPSGLPRLPLKPSPFGRLAEQGPAILTQVEEATRRINQLLGDSNQELITQSLGNLNQAAVGLTALTQRLDTTVVHKLDPALATLPPLAAQARQTLQTLQQAGESVTTLTNDFGHTSRRLTAEGGAIDQITLGTQALARAADQFGSSALPRLSRAADDTSRAARQVGRAANGVSDNPQLFIYGTGRIPPGPGEPGFVAP
jgi:phospholipid/cholesterol/gamma-HCH transport system substrate-binding protein